MSGKKFDQGKPPVTLLTKEFIFGTARALDYGTGKYGRDNYKAGMEWNRMLDSTFRHLFAFAGKENIDSESELCHLFHAAACLNMLIYYYETKTGTDDR